MLVYIYIEQLSNVLACVRARVCVCVCVSIAAAAAANRTIGNRMRQQEIERLIHPQKDFCCCCIWFILSFSTFDSQSLSVSVCLNEMRFFFHLQPQTFVQRYNPRDFRKFGFHHLIKIDFFEKRFFLLEISKLLNFNSISEFFIGFCLFKKNHLPWFDSYYWNTRFNQENPFFSMNSLTQIK